MTSIIPLGTFEPVPLRDAWPTENGNFTPWLANAANMSLLGNTLNMALEFYAIEHSVGSYRADIIARAIDDDDPHHRVIIENQFGPTDHGHLGQILTYLAGIEGARTVVWIAERIQQDHRAAVEWLNANTIEAFSFFAIEIELWRIGNSPPAPRFNVIASPNDWTRATRSAMRDAVAPPLAKARRIRLAYWTSFSEFIRTRHSAFVLRPTGLAMLHKFPIDQTDFQTIAMIVIRSRRAIVGLMTPRASDKVAFEALLLQKTAIESEFGEPLNWDARPSKKRSMISVSRGGTDLEDQVGYLDLHTWMLDKMERIQTVFAPRIRLLPPSADAEGRNDAEVDDVEE